MKKIPHLMDQVKKKLRPKGAVWNDLCGPTITVYALTRKRRLLREAHKRKLRSPKRST